MDWAVHQVNEKINYLNLYLARISIKLSSTGYSGTYVQPIPYIPKLEQGAIQNTFDLKAIVELIKLALTIPPLYDAEMSKRSPNMGELWEIRKGLENARMNISRMVNEMNSHI